MTEIVADVVIPSELILPDNTTGGNPTMSGAVFMSGGKINFYSGSAIEIVTSS